MEYKIKDINLAIEGRKELDLAETEMPGLMALRKEYAGMHGASGVSPCAIDITIEFVR